MPELLAREAELARLDGYLDKALRGQGQVCFISGEAGAGKTTLMEEFTARAIAAHESLVAVTGSCDAHTGSGDAFLPFREVMDQLTGGLDERADQGAEKQENAKRMRHLVVLAGETLVDLAPDLIGVVVPGASLLAKAGKYMSGKSKWADKLHKHIDGQSANDATAVSPDKAQVYEQYVNVLQRLGEVAPLLLVVDDLQWADTASLGLLFRLVRRIGDLPILLVGIYRPNDVAAGRDGQRHPLEAMLSEVKRYLGDVIIDLDDARTASGRDFVDALLDREANRLDTSFRENLVSHTGGHPLFTIELLRDLQERGDLVRAEDGAWVAQDHLRWDDLPTRVEGVIEERVARLDPDTIHSLRVASVEGPQFTAEIVAKVQPVDVRELIRSLSESLQRQHRLVTADGMRRIGGQRVSNYRFAHQLMQSYLYRQLDEAEASYLHEDVGLALEALYGEETDQIAVQLARHFDLAGLPDKAVPYLLFAGRQAAARFANEQAFEHYRRALALIPDDALEERYEASLAITELHGRRGESEQHEQDVLRLLEVAERTGDPLKLARAQYHRAYHALTSSKHDIAVQYARLSAEAAAPLDDEGLEGRARTVLGRALTVKADYAAAADELQKGLVLCRMAGNAAGEGLALSYLGMMADITGNAAAARSYFGQALSVHVAAGNRHAVAGAQLNLAVSHWRADELEAARDLLEQSLTTARELGDKGTEGTSTANLAMVLIDLGELELGQRMAEEAVLLNREFNGPYAVTRTLGILAGVLMRRREYTQARAATQEALELDESVGDKQDKAFQLGTLGQLAGIFGRYHEAEELLLRAIDLSREIAEPYAEMNALRGLATLRVTQGDAAEAKDLSSRAIALAEEHDAVGWLEKARLIHAEANVALGELDAASDEYQQVLDASDGELARDVHVGLAAVALARGDAGTALDLVKSLADDVGAGELGRSVEPLRAFAVVHGVLRAVHDARAQPVLEAARRYIADIRAKIDDPEALKTFDARSDVMALM